MSPIRNYYCSSCERPLEALVRLMDKPPVCPACGRDTIQVWSKPAPAQWNCSKGSL